MSRTVQYRLEYWLARIFSGMVRHIPPALGRNLGALLGQLAFSVFRLRRKVTLDNLRQAFPELNGQRKLVRIGACCYRHLGRSLVEFCYFPKLNRDNLHRILEIQGLEFVRDALSRGRGAILLSGHFGTWEFLGPAFALNGFAVDLFVRPQKNDLFDDLMTQHRRWVGADIIRSSQTPRAVLRSLQQNRLLVMLADQDGGRDGIFLPFMGRPASTPPGVARFALHTGAPVLMGLVIRQPGGRHRLIIDPPMEIPDTGDAEANLYGILLKYTENLERHIRIHPHQWFWPHRRWKTRPPAEKSAPPSPGDHRGRR